MGIRTRFAPSPTGYMHIGNLRTALYAFLLARGGGGQFILRIEDTDQGRKVEGSVDVIFDTLRSTGLNWDEGPDAPGKVGPYVQSERLGLYKQYGLELIDRSAAYYCFCGKEDKAEGTLPQKYDGRCARLPAAEVREKLESGSGWVIRQHMPREGSTSFEDAVYGLITVENSELEDQILIKSDGMPTYNFANVVDDHLMGITHVVRGNEYLSSTPKYNLLYKAFGWPVPEYIHCPPVMKNATEKLSKRRGDASFGDLVGEGYLPEAVLNYIALLGWSPGGENEIFTLDELVREFSLTGLSRSPAIFDPAKLKHINAEWIRSLPAEEFHRLALPWLRKTLTHPDISTTGVAALLQPRCEVFSDLPEKVDFFDSLPEYSNELYVHKKMKTTPESSREALEKILPALAALPEWTQDGIHECMVRIIEQAGVKNGIYLWPLRTALSGKPATPGGGVELAFLLGREESLRRIKSGLEQLSR